MRSLYMCAVFLSCLSCSFGATILEYLQSKPANFTYAVQAIKIANLTSELQTGGPFTAFIPTDAAFQKIPAPILQQLLNDQTAIRSLLLKHVTNGALISPFIKSGDNEVSLGGTNLTLTKDGAGAVMVNGVKVILPDVIVTNGVVQGIDFVFNVPAASVNMVEYLLKNSDKFSDLTAALTLGGLLSALEGPGPFTLFAPTDAAFATLSTSLQSLASDMNLFKNILKYHVVSGSTYAADLKDGQKVSTLAGSAFTVTKAGTAVSIDHAHVTQPDIPVLNGVIHVIDGVLVPATF
ncbi:periostin-like [Mytilus galloprovincialis]|uniref:periostin-like n=1 Tax=Mytilus edulis TaxID=6550 RepID=UPI0039EE02DA